MPQKYKVLPGKKPIAAPQAGKGTGSIPATGSGPRIADADFEGMQTTINATIHELVFVCKFIEDDQLEEAQNALMTAQGNLDELAQRLIAYPFA